jgi:cytochrome P450
MFRAGPSLTLSGMLDIDEDQATAPASVPHLDLLDPSFRFDADALSAAREASWYATTPLGLIVLRHAEVHELLRDRRFIQRGEEHLMLQGVTDGPLWDWFTTIVLFKTGDDHTRLRRLVNRAFIPAAVNGLRPAMRSAASRLIDSIADHDGCEFVDAFADPYPIEVMGRLLGVPVDDYHQLRQWSSDIGLTFSLSVAAQRERIETAVVGLHEYVDRLICHRRRNPGEDVVSTLIDAHDAGDRLNQAELRNMLVSFIFAGHDTTRNQLGNAIVSLAEHPSQWDLLARRPELADRAVEEVMRYRPAVPAIFRTATEDVERDGLTIPAGTFVLQCVQAANRDPRVFADPDRLDIEAERAAAHLSFGGGPHFCLGAWVARAELAEALPLLARTLSAPAISEVSWRPALGIFGPETLHIETRRRRFAAAARFVT